MPQRRTLIITGVLLLILIALILWYAWSALRAIRTVEAPVVTERVVQRPPVVIPLTKEQLAAKKAREESATVSALIKTFAERYGSFSTDAPFKNVRDVQTLASEAFAQTLEKSIKQEIPCVGTSCTFYGVTTRIVSLTIPEITPESTSLKTVAHTQREISSGTPIKTRLTYQDLEVQVEKQSNTWKVINAVWKE